MTRHPREATWEKPQGKRDPIRMMKRYTVAPRGIALVVGCSTFPTWNSYPGLFASLVTGNAVIVKPHPAAMLPLAITVAVARDVLAEAGFSPDLVLLAAEGVGEDWPALSPSGPRCASSTTPGRRVRPMARGQRAAGRSTPRERCQRRRGGFDRRHAAGCCRTSPSPCRCTAARCVRRRRTSRCRGTAWWRTGHRSMSNSSAVISPMPSPNLLGDDRRATRARGIVNDGAVTNRCCTSFGDVVLESRSILHPEFPDAVVRTPTIVRVDAASDVHQSGVSDRSRSSSPPMTPGKHRRAAYVGAGTRRHHGCLQH